MSSFSIIKLFQIKIYLKVWIHFPDGLIRLEVYFILYFSFLFVRIFLLTIASGSQCIFEIAWKKVFLKTKTLLFFLLYMYFIYFTRKVEVIFFLSKNVQIYSRPSSHAFLTIYLLSIQCWTQTLNENSVDISQWANSVMHYKYIA
jgi:hypothetical protein